MSPQIVILAAGKGTRMGSDIPKVLLPINKKPVVSYILDEIKLIPQASKPIIVVGFQEQLVKYTLGPDYLYVTQEDQKGTAHAVLSAKSAITAEHFIVLNGDMPFTKRESLMKLIESHLVSKAKVSMFTVTLPNFEDEYSHFLSWGRIVRAEDGTVIKIQEYKDSSEEQKLITEVNTGTYMFDSAWLWEKLEKISDNNAQHEFYLTDIVELAIVDGQHINALVISAKEAYGINNPDDLEFARKLTS